MILKLHLLDEPITKQQLIVKVYDYDDKMLN